MISLRKKLSLKEFDNYINQKSFKRKIDKLVIHHTWIPTKEQWSGLPSILALETFYTRKFWNAGPHIFISEDGIWLFTDINKQGIHAGIGNYRSIGIEVVGDYDTKKWSGETKKNALGAIKILMKHFNMDTESVFFHNDFSKKSCPGHSITKEWLFKELNYYNEDHKIPEWKNVAGNLSAKDIWKISSDKGFISEKTRPDDELTVLKFMIFLARMFPDKFKK